MKHFFKMLVAIMVLLPVLAFATPVMADDPVLVEIAQVQGRNLAIDSLDNMYVSSYSEHKVVKVTPAGVVTDFATGIPYAREGICDADDNLYVGDSSGKVWKITPSGSKTPIASGIESIQGLALDNAGNLYASSQRDKMIYKIDLSSEEKTVFSMAFVSATTWPSRMIVDQSTNDLYVSVGTHWPPLPPPGGPVLFLAKMALTDPSSYETIATLPGVYGGGTMYFNTNGNLLWSCLVDYVYDSSTGNWEFIRYDSEILEFDLATGTLTEFLKVDGLLIEGMAFDSSGQFFIAGTREITYENYIYSVGASANQPPVLDPINNKSVNEGETLSFTVSATDPEVDPLTYLASNLPAGATFVGNTFTWTPDFTQAGTYAGVHFEVTDGTATDSEDITITVIDVPPAEATEDLISDIEEEFNLPAGTENSIVSPLESAIDSFDKGQDNAGINKLDAFINKVEAQRGKKLTDEQADELIEMAQSIIDNI